MASDFFTVEVWTRAAVCSVPGVVLYRNLDAERACRFHRKTANGLWMSQVARDLTDPTDGRLSKKRYLIGVTMLQAPDTLSGMEFLADHNLAGCDLKLTFEFLDNTRSKMF